MYGKIKTSLDSERKTIYFDSIFLPVKGESKIIPVRRDGAGGGMTLFGDAIVLLTHEGKIYAARSADEI